MDAINQVLTLVGYIVIGGGGLGFIVFQIFKHLGAKWLDARFDERLQKLKHAQAQEIEALRFKVSAQLDRATKLHQREFEVLPEAWAKLCTAFWTASALASPFQQQADLNRMKDSQREDVISKSRLLDWQKDEVRDATDKTARFSEMMSWHALSDAKKESTASSRYLGVESAHDI